MHRQFRESGIRQGWTETSFDCDPLYTLEKSALTRKRGEVRSPERRRDIARKIIQGLAFAGL
jgi:hypothetical protein